MLPPCIVDFLCPAAGLIVEVDADTHADRAADDRRDQALRARSFAVLRVTNGEVIANLDGVAVAIAARPEQAMRSRRHPHPNPSPEGEGR